MGRRKGLAVIKDSCLMSSKVYTATIDNISLILVNLSLFALRHIEEEELGGLNLHV